MLPSREQSDHQRSSIPRLQHISGWKLGNPSVLRTIGRRMAWPPATHGQCASVHVDNSTASSCDSKRSTAECSAAQRPLSRAAKNAPCVVSRSNSSSTDRHRSKSGCVRKAAVARAKEENSLKAASHASFSHFPNSQRERSRWPFTSRSFAIGDCGPHRCTTTLFATGVDTPSGRRSSSANSLAGVRCNLWAHIAGKTEKLSLSTTAVKNPA